MLHVAFSLSKFYFEFIVLYFTVLDNISCLPAEMIFDLPNSILTLYLSLHTGWTRDSVGRVWQNTARGVACEAEAIDNDLWYPVIQPQRTGHNWHRARKKKNKKKKGRFPYTSGSTMQPKKGSGRECWDLGYQSKSHPIFSYQQILEILNLSYQLKLVLPYMTNILFLTNFRLSVKNPSNINIKIHLSVSLQNVLLGILGVFYWFPSFFPSFFS